MPFQVRNCFFQTNSECRSYTQCAWIRYQFDLHNLFYVRCCGWGFVLEVFASQQLKLGTFGIQVQTLGGQTVWNSSLNFQSATAYTAVIRLVQIANETGIGVQLVQDALAPPTAVTSNWRFGHLSLDSPGE